LEKIYELETGQGKEAFLRENGVVVNLWEAMCVYVQVKKTAEIFCKAEDNY